MGTICGKFGKRRSSNKTRNGTTGECILTQLRRFRRNRVVPVNILPTPVASKSSCSYTRSRARQGGNGASYDTADEIAKENCIKDYDKVIVLKVSSSHLNVFANADQELELTDVTNDHDKVEETHPSSKVESEVRSITPNLPSFVKELISDVDKLISNRPTSESDSTVRIRVRPKAAKGIRTPVKVQLTRSTGEEYDSELPGEVFPSSKYFSVSSSVLSRPQLTVPAVRTTEQKCLDNWMKRQIQEEKAVKCVSDSD